MTGSPYYIPTGAPSTGSPGASATIRSEFDLIADGFGLLPQTLTANKAVIINAGGTALDITTGGLTLAGDFSTSGAYSVALTATAATALTLPTTGTLATLAGTEALTNKTYNGNTWTAGSGTLTLGAGKTATISNTLTFTGTDSSSVAFGAGGTVLYSGGAYVSSITGTANQITASASTGAVTLSFPSVVQIATSLAINGATIGSNKLAVSGASSFVGAFGVANASASPVISTFDNTSTGQAAISIRGNSVGNKLQLVAGSIGESITADDGLTITAGTSITLATATTLSATLTAAAANFSGLVTASAGLNVPTGQYLKLAGVNTLTGDTNNTVVFPPKTGGLVLFQNFANSGTNMIIADGGVITMGHYGVGTATFDASGNISSVSDPTQKIITGGFHSGLDEVVATSSDEFMGLHTWTPESGMETEGEYASFFARDNFPIAKAVWKNPKTGINSFNDRAVIMALVKAVATLKAGLDAVKRSG